MNVSSVNCTPIKPQVSFGQEQEQDHDFVGAQRVLDMSKELSDSFAKEGEQKTKLQTLASIGGALATTFLLGRAMGTRIVNAGIHTKVAAGAKTLVSKLQNLQAPNFVKNSKFADKLKNGTKVISENPKVAGATAKITKQGQKIVGKVQTYINDKGVETVIKNSAGVASMAVLGSQVAKVDGNSDGIADIAQKNVNAYKNAIDNMGVVGEIAKVLV